MKVVVLDTETTGFDPKQDKVVEWAHVAYDTEKMARYGFASILFDPEIPMPPTARAVHHISNEDVAGKRPFPGEVGSWDFSRVDAFAAHNAEFDRGFVGEHVGDAPWICTWRCARHIWPDAPAFGNQVLRYWLDLDVRFPDHPGAQHPHRALYDAVVTASVLERMLQSHAVSELIELTTKPIIMKKVGFGKHYGKEWKDVETDYLQWILRGTFDADVKATAAHWIKVRADERAARTKAAVG